VPLAVFSAVDALSSQACDGFSPLRESLWILLFSLYASASDSVDTTGKNAKLTRQSTKYKVHLSDFPIVEMEVFLMDGASEYEAVSYAWMMIFLPASFSPMVGILKSL
jgi:hypothetical protein